jgi:hypothetical protein
MFGIVTFETLFAYTTVLIALAALIVKVKKQIPPCDRRYLLANSGAAAIPKAASPLIAVLYTREPG